MRLRGAGGCGRASLRRRPRPRGPRPVSPRARCGSLFPPQSRAFECGGVGGEARVRAAQPSARSLPRRVGASPRRPQSPPPREDVGGPRRPHRAGHAAPTRRRRSHMPEPQPCEQAAPTPCPAAPGPGSGAVPLPGPGAVAPA